jgi:hypothetical protein
MYTELPTCWTAECFLQALRLADSPLSIKNNFIVHPYFVIMELKAVDRQQNPYVFVQLYNFRTHPKYLASSMETEPSVRRD